MLERLEQYHGPVSREWLDEYQLGRGEFIQRHTAQAEAFFVQDCPAEALVEASITLQAPRPSSVARQIVEADDTARAYDLDIALDSVRPVLSEVVDRSQMAIEGYEIEAWQDALSSFKNGGWLHAAGFAAIKLGAAYEKSEQPMGSLVAYVAASRHLRQSVADLTLRGEPARHAAEYRLISNNLVTALSAVINACRQVGYTRGLGKGLIQAAVYDLENIDGPREAVRRGYNLLAGSSRNAEEQGFYRGRARDIAAQIALERFFDSSNESQLRPLAASQYLRPAAPELTLDIYLKPRFPGVAVS